MVNRFPLPGGGGDFHVMLLCQLVHSQLLEYLENWVLHRRVGISEQSREQLSNLDRTFVIRGCNIVDGFIKRGKI